jgi:hypothetical protein
MVFDGMTVSESLSKSHRIAISYPQDSEQQRNADSLEMRGDGVPRIDWDEWCGWEVDKICGSIFSK